MKYFFPLIAEGWWNFRSQGSLDGKYEKLILEVVFFFGGGEKKQVVTFLLWNEKKLRWRNKKNNLRW